MTPSLAQEHVVDGWGLARADDATRAEWAGFRTRIDGSEDEVGAGPAADVLFYLGEKSMVAGRDEAQAAALVLDRAGNLVADRTPVTLTHDRASQIALTRNGIAGALFAGGTVAGQFHAGAGAAGVQGSRTVYVVTPDLASLRPRLQPDDGTGLVEDIHEFRTAPLVDRFGNPAVDGTGLTFLVKGSAGAISFLPSVAAGGVARARLLVRDIGSAKDLSGTAQAILGQFSSLPVNFAIRPLAAQGALAINARSRPDIGAVDLTIGPFLTDAGYALDDGAPVTVRARLADGEIQFQDVWVLDGIARTTLIAGNSDLPISLTINSSLGEETLLVTSLSEGQP